MRNKFIVFLSTLVAVGVALFAAVPTVAIDTANLKLGLDSGVALASSCPDCGGDTCDCCGGHVGPDGQSVPSCDDPDNYDGMCVEPSDSGESDGGSGKDSSEESDGDDPCDEDTAEDEPAESGPPSSVFPRWSDEDLELLRELLRRGY